MAIIKAFRSEDGQIIFAEEGSELFANLVEEGNQVEIPALNQEVSDDGLTNVSTIVQKPSYSHVSGRYYMYSSGLWVTESDDNYGTSYYQFFESAGLSSEPIYEWEHHGTFYKAGTTIKDFTLTGRASSDQVTDIEIRLVAKYPNDPDAWRTGFTGDSSMSTKILFKGKYSDMGVDVGPKNLVTKGCIELNQVLDQDSYVCMYIRRVGTLTGTRYFTGSRIIGVI